MSNIKGFFQSFTAKKSEEEIMDSTQTTDTISVNEDGDDPNVVSTHVYSNSDQFLNMTAIALDAAPAPEAEELENTEIDTNEDAKERESCIFPEFNVNSNEGSHTSGQSIAVEDDVTERDTATIILENESLEEINNKKSEPTQSDDPILSENDMKESLHKSSNDSKLAENHKATRLLMSELMKSSIEASNQVS